MNHPSYNQIKRLSDGSIDYRYYATKGKQAKNEELGAIARRLKEASTRASRAFWLA